jgi:hypothetical protein
MDNIGIGTANPGYRLDIVGGDSSIQNTGWVGQWIRNFSNDTSYPYLVFQKSRGASIGTMATTNINDSLGDIQFKGVDTSNTSQTGAQIFSVQDAAAGASFIRGSLVFATDDGAGMSTRMTLSSSGNIGIGTTAPTEKLDISGDTIRIQAEKTPASATASCDKGEIVWDADYVYVCVATDTWKRSMLTTW